MTSSKDRSCRVWDLRDIHHADTQINPMTTDQPKAHCRAIAEGHADAVGCVVVSQKRSTYVSKQGFFISGAGDKILKRWPLLIHNLSNVNNADDISSSSNTVRTLL